MTTVSASPIQELQGQLIAALGEVANIGASRQAALEKWADCRARLIRGRNGSQTGVRQEYERQVTLLRLLDSRLLEAKAKVRLLDAQVLQGRQRWALRNRMEASARPGQAV